jgi:hypothetical protein
MADLVRIDAKPPQRGFRNSTNSDYLDARQRLN